MLGGFEHCTLRAPPTPGHFWPVCFDLPPVNMSFAALCNVEAYVLFIQLLFMIVVSLFQLMKYF